MVKYYYDDPLQAAYMLREFNFKIGCYDIDDLNYFEEDSLNSLSDGIGNNQIESDIDSAYIIHPDCHEMLQPQVGDVIMDLGSKKIKYFPIYKITYSDSYLCIQKYFRGHTYCYKPELIQIIQRNGKAWFNPKVEESKEDNPTWDSLVKKAYDNYIKESKKEPE